MSSPLVPALLNEHQVLQLHACQNIEVAGRLPPLLHVVGKMSNMLLPCPKCSRLPRQPASRLGVSKLSKQRAAVMSHSASFCHQIAL